MSTPTDQRRSERKSPVLAVSYPDRAAALEGTRAVGQGGLFVPTDDALDPGQAVTLQVSFPGGGAAVQVTGRIAWVRPVGSPGGRGVGIAVDGPDERARLERLLSEEARSAPAPVAPAPAPGGYRVLIVEDNPHIIEMYSYVLKKLAQGELKGQVPLEVHFAGDGHAAFTQLKQGTFSLVMTDLYMPVMDGFQLVDKIRADEGLKSIPVVAISAGGQDAKDKAMRAGVDVFLRKPVKFAEVLETVKQLLRIR